MKVPWQDLKRDGRTELEDVVRLLGETLSIKETLKRLNLRWGNDRTINSIRAKLKIEDLPPPGRMIAEAKQKLRSEAIAGDEDAAAQLDAKRRDEELRELEARVSKKIDNLLDAQDAEKRLTETVAQIVEGFKLKPLRHPPKVAKPPKSKTVESAVLALSDFHIGEVVSAEETRGLGEYNWQIFESRLTYVVQTVERFLLDNMAAHHFRRLNLFMLGDMISGRIHEELERTNEYTEVEWVMGGAYVMAQAVLYLAQRFPEVRCVGVAGNHGRLTKKPASKQVYANLDHFLYLVAGLLTRHQPNVSWHVPKSFFALEDVEGHSCLLYHGDDIQMYKRFPYYGIDQAIIEFKELLEASGERLDHAFLGHFHRATVLPRVRGDVFVNGSLVGPTEFSIKKLRGGARARQWLVGFHEEMGPTWHLPLDPEHAAKKVAEPLFTYDPTRSILMQVGA